jgi:hypothetical protein
MLTQEAAERSGETPVAFVDTLVLRTSPYAYGVVRSIGLAYCRYIFKEEGALP